MIIKNNYIQDKNGEWWYSWGSLIKGNQRRTKAILKKCAYEKCGNIFTAKPSAFTFYCSKKCSGLDIGGVAGAKRRGDLHYSWRGGKRKDPRGYVLIYSPDHPHPEGGRYVREHRLVMERSLGRYLETFEYVHHKNGVKNDNRLENLQLVNTHNHEGEIQCPHCLKTFLIK